jgi:hypothetical protein
MDEKTTTRRVTAGDYDVTTHVQYSLVEGEYMVRLNPDAERLPTPPCPDLTAARARELARNLNAGADDADRRNGTVPERCDVHGGRSLAACDHPAVPAAVAEAVRQFLDEQLGRDDMTLAEIAAEAVAIATGASTFEPVEDEPTSYEPARLQAGPRPDPLVLAAREAQALNEPVEVVEWAGRTFGQLTPAERARVTSQAAGQLQAELQASAVHPRAAGGRLPGLRHRGVGLHLRQR